MELRFRCAFYPFYIKSEVQSIYFWLNVNDRLAQVTMHLLTIMNHSFILLDDRMSRKDGVGGLKGPGSVLDYPQIYGCNVGTMTN